MIKQAAELNSDSPGCEFRFNTWPDLRDFDDQSFDLVYSGRVLQHLPDKGAIESYVAEFLRVVREDGVIAFQLPHKLSLPVRLMPRRNLYLLLRTLGLSSTFLYWRLGLHPMRMTSVGKSEIADFLESHGGRVLAVDEQGRDMGCENSLYFVATGRGHAREAGPSVRIAADGEPQI